jgi:alkylation response protein AidB-like acyl-CoA dehydrogenase
VASEYLYSRAATIYGGTLEVQRNIIARGCSSSGATNDRGRRAAR